jgi:NAD(P)H-dependent FMN reductase
MPAGVATTLYGGMNTLPHFNPDDDREGGPVDPAVTELRAQITAADALLICTPEYAGALPGALKNLLECTVGDGATYRKPIAWINASGPAAPTGGADAHDSLGKVLGYVHAELIEDACARIPVTRAAIADRRSRGDSADFRILAIWAPSSKLPLPAGVRSAPKRTSREAGLEDDCVGYAKRQMATK